VEESVSIRRSLTAALAVVTLQGCGMVLSDDYGNSYGSFFDYGSQYAWQRDTCQSEVTARTIDVPYRQRYMQCCMWRHGVPIKDSTGCLAPPYNG
jgi:uncharacterized protein YceK